MSKAVEKLEAAMQRAMAGRRKVGGFPYLAETLRRAGVTRNLWHLPSCQSLYVTEEGPVVVQGTPLLTGMVDVLPFDSAALIAALRADQAGKSTFAAFLLSAWKAGVVSYEVDLVAHSCTYFGASGENYVESYPAMDL